jgi:hypothetical protein
MALHRPFKGKVNDFLIVTNLGIEGRLNEVNSSQKLYRKIVYNTQHHAYR